ncbi:MAG: hypothetical protein JXJ20_07475 [Anaerolineae bacterium]|nr:hypothetical protein [Anaerolineae bacterium]
MAKRKLVHFEIPAHDRRAAAAFYGDLFDWTFEHTDERSLSLFSFWLALVFNLMPMRDSHPGELAQFFHSRLV